MDRIPVMLVDDNPTFLRVASEFLEASDDVTVVGTANGGKEALACIHSLQPRVILTDLAMPGMPGLEFIPLLRQVMPQVSIVALTVMNSHSFRQATLAVGADAFISKANLRTDLLPTIRRLARSSESQDEELTVALSPNPTPQNSILIVEDDASLCRLYAKALRQAGYEVREAGTMGEARELLREVRFDLLLCDIHMSDGRCTDLLSEFADQLLISGAQVVMVSGQSQYRELCREIGADFFLEKPVAVATLVGLVNRLTARHEYESSVTPVQ